MKDRRNERRSVASNALGATAVCAFERKDLLLCAVDDSPSDKTSCAFFSAKGLATTLECFGCHLETRRAVAIPGHLEQIGTILRQKLQALRERGTIDGTDSLKSYITASSQLASVRREYAVYRKAKESLDDPLVWNYWNGTYEFDQY